MVSVALAGILVCVITLFRGHRAELRERAIIFFISFVIFLELASLLLNISGRYNLAKALLVSGYVNVVVGVLLIWTVRLLDEGLKLANEIYKKPDRNSLYINFERVGKKVPRVFYILILIGWLIIFGRNFYAFKFITEPLNDFLYDERTIGEFKFAIFNILIFFLILVISAMLSKLVSFFASDNNEWKRSSAEKKSGIGSWVLLIRILIITMGIWIAMAAAGIPMDKAAIVFGALGVGIGLGLQSLVNNLVSGLIIAFEKPVNVGDIIEISGKSGVIRTIGFRSSIVNTWDGSDVIIPNGDLLNAHLVNWTRGNTVRRVEIALGIAIGSDLDKVKELITELFSTNDRVLKDPPPFVVANDFTNNSLNISIYFWVSHTREWKALRSEFIVAINKLLKENAIVFAIPQQDITVSNEPTNPGPDNKNEEKKI
jgi:small-conductance mechanosensitive channel